MSRALLWESWTRSNIGKGYLPVLVPVTHGLSKPPPEAFISPEGGRLKGLAANKVVKPPVMA